MAKRGVLAVVGAIAAVLSVRWVAVALVDVPPDFLPLARAGASIFFTAVLGTAAVLVFAVVRRVAERPERSFRWIATVALLLSFVPDLWMLTEAGSEAFAGATPVLVGVLMLLHVTAAAVIVPVLTLVDGRREDSP